jgi:hypothetical protein
MFIYAKIGNSKFVEMHGMLLDIHPAALIFYTRHRVNITISPTVYLHTRFCSQLEHKRNEGYVIVSTFPIAQYCIASPFQNRTKMLFVYEKQIQTSWEQKRTEGYVIVSMGNVDRTFCPKLLSTKPIFSLFFLISVTKNHSSHIKYVHICEDWQFKIR